MENRSSHSRVISFTRPVDGVQRALRRTRRSPRQRLQQRVFIVEDLPVFRKGLAGLVKRELGLTICGQADNAAQALSRIERLKPELVLAEIGLSGKSGLRLIGDILAVCPKTEVLVISMHDESLYAERVLRTRGGGHIVKQEGSNAILQAIREVLDGQICRSSKMPARLADNLAGHQGKKVAPTL